MANPNIDGFFIGELLKIHPIHMCIHVWCIAQSCDRSSDDGWGAGPSEEDSHAVADMGLAPVEVAKVRAGWASNMAAVKAKILSAGGYNWQMFDVNGGTNAAAPFRKEDCTSYMRSTACLPTSRLQNQSLFYGYTDYQKGGEKGVLPYFHQDLASFLLIRGPYAWLGYSWMGCFNDKGDPTCASIKYHFPPELGVDYGEPLSTCSETAPGSEIFTRKWSKATVTLNCKTWEGNITMV